MHIKSFIDIVSTDQNTRYYVASLATDEDLFSGDPTVHTCEIYKRDRIEFKAEVFFPHEIINIRKELNTHLQNKENIVLINKNAKKIFSNIQNDSFFIRLVDNLDKKEAYDVEWIQGTDRIKDIIETALPILNPSAQQKQSMDKRIAKEKARQEAFDAWEDNTFACVIL